MSNKLFIREPRVFGLPCPALCSIKVVSFYAFIYSLRFRASSDYIIHRETPFITFISF